MTEGLLAIVENPGKEVNGQPSHTSHFRGREFILRLKGVEFEKLDDLMHRQIGWLQACGRQRASGRRDVDPHQNFRVQVNMTPVYSA
jgi:hypothetical protein